MRTEQFSLPLATSTQVFDTLVRVIRYDEGSGTGTPKIRIKSLSGGAFDVEMVPGRQIKLPETVRGLHISNMTAAAITGKITIGAGDISDNSLVGTVTLDAATLAALATTGLDAATLAALEQINVRPELRSASYQQLANMAANTPDTIFSAASNPNGAILLDAFGSGHSAGSPVQPTFIAKATAPANVTDGEVIYSAPCVGYGGGTWVNAGDMPAPRYIPPGTGLYFLVTDPATFCMRHCRYKLL